MSRIVNRRAARGESAPKPSLIRSRRKSAHWFPARILQIAVVPIHGAQRPRRLGSRRSVRIALPGLSANAELGDDEVGIFVNGRFELALGDYVGGADFDQGAERFVVLWRPRT